MKYSRIADSLRAKIASTPKKVRTEVDDITAELSAALIEQVNASDHRPIDLPSDTYDRLIAELDSIDACVECGENAEISDTTKAGKVLESSACEPATLVASLVNDTTYNNTLTPAYLPSILKHKNHRFTNRPSRKPVMKVAPDDDLSSAQVLRLLIKRDYDHLRPHERIAVTAKHVLLTGALDFTVNLSFERQAWLLRIRPDDRAKRLADEIQRYGRQAFGGALPLAFILEVSDAGNIHAHGFIATPDHSPEMIAKVRAVLRAAGGMTEGYFRAKQIDVGIVRDLGWMRYMRKDVGGTIKFLGTQKLTYSSQALSRLARAAHEEERARMKALKVGKRETPANVTVAAAIPRHGVACRQFAPEKPCRPDSKASASTAETTAGQGASSRREIRGRSRTRRGSRRSPRQSMLGLQSHQRAGEARRSERSVSPPEERSQPASHSLPKTVAAAIIYTQAPISRAPPKETTQVTHTAPPATPDEQLTLDKPNASHRPATAVPALSTVSGVPAMVAKAAFVFEIEPELLRPEKSPLPGGHTFGRGRSVSRERPAMTTCKVQLSRPLGNILPHSGSL